jgi:predicted kinase
MPKVYVLVGVPGSGKSTWVANQEWAANCAYVSTDHHVEARAAALGKTYNEVWADYMPTAIKMMANDVNIAAAEGKDIIWDQTSTSKASRRKKFKMLPKYYHIAVVFKTPEKAELDRRLAGRVGKHIPQKVMEQMIARLELPTKEEGYNEIWYAS